VAETGPRTITCKAGCTGGVVIVLTQSRIRGVTSKSGCAGGVVVFISQTGASIVTIKSRCGTVLMMMMIRAETFANRPWLALESIIEFLSTGQRTTLFLEICHVNSWEGGGRMMLSSIVVDFVDGNRGVYDVRLDCLFVNNGLDIFVDVVVNVLASNSWRVGLCMCRLSSDALILELCSLLLKSLCYIFLVAMVVFTVLDGTKVMVVFLRQNLAVVYGLHRGVVVILMYFLV